MTEQDQEPNGDGVSLKLLVTIVLVIMAVASIYILYSGVMSEGRFQKQCEEAKGKPADAVLAELVSIGGQAGPPSENGTIVVERDGGGRCTVRVTDKKVFSALFEE